MSSYSVTCKADQTYNEPNTWPVCVDKLDCTEPAIDPTVMVYDWTEDVGITPPFEIKYIFKFKLNPSKIKVHTKT